MRLPRLFATFTPKQWINDVPVRTGELQEIDVTEAILRMPSYLIVDYLDLELQDSQLPYALIDRLRLESALVRRHTDGAAPHCCDLILDRWYLYHFFRDLDAHPLDEEMMFALRQQYEIMEAIRMPNSLMMWPTGTEEAPRIFSLVQVLLEELFYLSAEGLHEVISIRMTGCLLLRDICYSAIRASGDTVVLEVDGDASDIVAAMRGGERPQVYSG